MKPAKSAPKNGSLPTVGVDQYPERIIMNKPERNYFGTGSGIRVLLYSHDTFGLGHLQRCLKISRALMARYPDLAVLLATGSPLVHRYQLPAGVDYVKLPAVRKIGPEQYEARVLATSYERIIKVRTSLLLGAAQNFDPHVLLVDHSPIGMKGEMLPALQWLRESGSSCINVIGLRDILDDPKTVIATWQREGIYEVLKNFYDHVLVYGSADVFNPTKAYELPPEVHSKTIFCNYIRESVTEKISVDSRRRGETKRMLVVVTIGGGDGGGETVIGNYLEMVRKFKAKIDFDSIVLTGPFLPAELARRFQAIAADLPVTLKPFVSSTTPYFRKSDLVISTAGYNSITQIMEAGKRALIIPRILHRDEQLIRAQRFADLGLVSILHPDDVTPESLYHDVSRLLSNKSEPLTLARQEARISLDGTDNIIRFFNGLFSTLNISQENEHGS